MDGWEISRDCSRRLLRNMTHSVPMSSLSCSTADSEAERFLLQSAVCC
jgi:hypothetical protein